MSKCQGPRAAGIQWDCDMQHGIVNGRCAECQIMAEAGSNLSLEQIDAVRAPALTRKRRILTEMDAKEAAMNGAKVRYRRSPPYLTCPRCGGDGTNLHPYFLECGPHEAGWEIVQPSIVSDDPCDGLELEGWGARKVSNGR